MHGGADFLLRHNGIGCCCEKTAEDFSSAVFLYAHLDLPPDPFYNDRSVSYDHHDHLNHLDHQFDHFKLLSHNASSSFPFDSQLPFEKMNHPSFFLLMEIFIISNITNGKHCSEIYYHLYYFIISIYYVRNSVKSYFSICFKYFYIFYHN